MGDTESIKGFAALGLDIFPCDREEEAAPLFRRLTAGGEYGVVFWTTSCCRRSSRFRA